LSRRFVFGIESDPLGRSGFNYGQRSSFPKSVYFVNGRDICNHGTDVSSVSSKVCTYYLKLSLPLGHLPILVPPLREWFWCGDLVLFFSPKREKNNLYFNPFFAKPD